MSFSETFTRLKNFLTHGVWRVDATDSSWKKTLRIALLTYKGYMQDDLTIHATSLTYGTLTSLVPVLAVVIAIMRAFGMGDDVFTRLSSQSWYAELPAGMQQFFDKLLEIVTHTNFFALGWIGLLVFILTAVFLLMNVERSFNRVWGVRKERDLFKQIPIYTTLLVAVPLVIGLLVTVHARLYIDNFNLKSMGLIDASTWGQHLFSFVILWLTLFATFILVPNTKVEPAPSVGSSFVTALILVIWMRLFTVMQIGVAKYNYIYGALAALPIFLFWLYVMWVLLLLGVELTFAMQNQATYEQERRASTASASDRLAVALALLVEAGSLQRRRASLDLNDFARAHRVPFRLASDVADELQACRYLSESASDRTLTLKGVPAQMALAEIVSDVNSGSSGTPIMEDLGRRFPELGTAFDSIRVTLISGLAGKTLADIIPAPSAASARDSAS
ncbi:MAG: YihY/virulence factor BrkB family protein [Kiritimatiellae bacterium]|nr:YihY/virulence factor BrkB family protein [Kiritimatiellia bacterium]